MAQEPVPKKDILNEDQQSQIVTLNNLVQEFKKSAQQIDALMGMQAEQMGKMAQIFVMVCKRLAELPPARSPPLTRKQRKELQKQKNQRITEQNKKP